MGLLAGFLGAQVVAPTFNPDVTVGLSGRISLGIFILVCIVIRRWGLLKGMLITIGVMAFTGTLMGVISVGLDQLAIVYMTLDVVKNSTLNFFTITLLCLTMAISQAMINYSYFYGYLGATIGAMSVPLMTVGPIAENLGIVGTMLAVAIANILIYICFNLARQALAGDTQHSLIQSFAITTVSAVGTRFYQANLTQANFTRAKLACTDFRASGIDYVRWDQAEGLARVRWGNSPMSHAIIRELLTTRSSIDGKGQKRNLAGVNLSGADLSYLDFQQVNLKGANLLKANLQGTDLTQANLTLVQALGTDFTGAIMTGSCIEGWAIDDTTHLADVECRFVYRLEKPKPGTVDRERCPSSGVFEPGDFTTLFQAVLNTVELIFRNGIDRDAIAAALSQVQTTYDPRIQLRGMEDRGDGFFKVTLGIPEGISKSDLHHEFRQVYQDHLKQLENRYQAHLQAAQQQINHYQQTTTELTAILKQLTDNLQTARTQNADSSGTLTQHQKQPDRWVILTFWDGSLAQGYPITADIHLGLLAEPLKFHASLPPAPALSAIYQQWQTLYSQAFGHCSRIQFEDSQVTTNVSRQELDFLADQLAHQLRDWLQSASFRLIADKLREKFLPDQEIRVFIQTEDIWLRRLPWHLWDFLNDYPNPEVALSGMVLERKVNSQTLRTQTRILAIVGNSFGINTDIDCQLLRPLAHSNIEVNFLKEPNRQQFNEYLWDKRGWDIFYFSGHSFSQQDGSSGLMQLNRFDQISIEDLQFALAAAVNQGLQLAVLNSCDGLGLAQRLCTLKIPQIIVMKEPIPDNVAHCFLKYFLEALNQKQTLHSAVRAARQQLAGLEDRYPYASWLPVLFQTTLETTMPWLNVRQPDNDQD